MSNLPLIINNFFFGNPKDIGIEKIPSKKIIELMNKTDCNNDISPYASDVKHLLFHKSCIKEKDKQQISH